MALAALAAFTVTGPFMIVAVATLDLVTLVKVASTMMIIPFLLVNVSVITTREGRMQHYRPSFRSPLYPWAQGGAMALYAFLVFRMGAVPLVVTGAFFGGSLVWYALHAKRCSRQDSALVRLVHRAMSRELVTSSLDTQLREILKVRDEITEDCFDRLVKRSTILIAR